MLKCYLLLFLITIIIILYLITEVYMNNMNNLENVQCTMRNSSMENFYLDCLDQLILVVHLPDVSVTNTNDCYYLL